MHQTVLICMATCRRHRCKLIGIVHVKRQVGWPRRLLIRRRYSTRPSLHPSPLHPLDEGRPRCLWLQSKQAACRSQCRPVDNHAARTTRQQACTVNHTNGHLDHGGNAKLVLQNDNESVYQRAPWWAMPCSARSMVQVHNTPSSDHTNGSCGTLHTTLQMVLHLESGAQCGGRRRRESGR